MDRSRRGKRAAGRDAQPAKRPPGGASSGAKTRPAPPPRGAEAGLDTVREILFGGALRELTAELARQEERTQRALQELRDDMRRHDQAVEAFAKRELESLSKQVAAESSARAEGAQGLLHELQKAIAAFEKRDSQLESSQAQAARELREQLLARTNELLERQRGWREEILAALAEGLDGVRATETDRTTLANLLAEMSSRLASASPSASTMH